MKIETIKDPNIFNHDFKAPWLNEISYKEWCKFLAHNYAYGREEAYNILRTFLTNYQLNMQTFLEIGFGQCYDFEHCFKDFHYNDKIIYNGWEITKQFVLYARQKYSDDKYYNLENCFKIGTFKDLEIPEVLLDKGKKKFKEFDIIYTRHTLEHQHPDNCYKYFENILKAAKKLAIITWFKPPKKEKFTWNDRDGENKGAYVNTYSKEKLMSIVKKIGFNLEIVSIQYKRIYNEMWVMEKA